MVKQLMVFLVLFLGMPGMAAEQYSLGVVPQQSPLKLFKTWKPLADYLSAQTGHEIIFKTEKSIAEFEQVLYSGGYDCAYMNPYHYVVAHRQQGYEAVARDSDMLQGILVAPAGTVDFTSLINNPDTTYLFPSPNAFAATLLTKSELLDKFGVNIEKQQHFQYVNSHDSVYAGVARGVGQIGGGIQRTFDAFSKTHDKDKLEIVYTTGTYPSHPFALKPGLDEAFRQKLLQALADMPQPLAEALNMKKIIPTNDAEYNVIRSLENTLTTLQRD